MAPATQPFTDYGFKKLFGEEPNKDLLLDFLNELLKEEQGEIRQIVLRMSKRKLPEQEISDLTGLSVERIHEIIRGD